MDRRLVLAGLAAVTAAPLALIESALAQSSSPTASSPAGQGAGAAAGGGTYNQAGGGQAGGQMSQAEQQWMQQTMAMGMVALETSKVALQKTEDEDLKQFAKFEVDEQQTLSEVLNSLMGTGAMAGGSAANTTGSAGGASMPPMDAKNREMVQKLQQASGSAFDKQYYQGQLQGHRDLLQIQENFIKSGSRNREAVNVAKLARGRIQEHIELIESIDL